MMETNGQRHTQLYTNALKDFCKDNKLYIDLLKDHVEELDRLKQYDKQVKEAKTENEIYRQSKAADPRNLAVMFTQMGAADKRLFKTAAKSGEYEDMLTSSNHHTENPFCYLCTTIEQHKKHVMKTEKRIHGKKRIPYEAPPPFVPPKPPPPKPESKDCLFKVTVKTGVDIEAACSAPAYITLQGKEDKLKKARLVKKFGSLGFFFDSGSTEVFHLRGPLIGKLERMVLSIEHPDQASTEERHHQKWLVESVSVKDYSLGLEYNFIINKWLRHGVSKRSGERRDQMKLAPTSTAKSATSSGRGLHIIVHTAKKATSGTDCRVYISFMGSSAGSGKARHELRQPPEEERIFQPSSKDLFELYVDDFGELKGIRLEIDVNNLRPPEKSDKKSSSKSYTASKSWFVDQVIVKDIKTGQKWVFTISDWLNEETPLKEFWTVKDVEDKQNSIYSQKTLYEIVTKTSKKDLAGTDSTIYLSLFDKENRRCDIELKDEDKTKFERGKVDRIRETARVIDTPERIRISISGKGVAPDWHLEGIEITKYLVADEILQYLQRLQFSNKMPDGLTREKGKILFGRPDAKHLKQPGARSASKERASWDKKVSGKKVSATSAKDFVDGDILGRRGDRSRSAAIRKSLAKPKDSDDSEEDEELSDSDASEESVKSHDDFDPERGLVRLPYAIKVNFAPRSQDDAWIKKDKSLELRALAPGELIYSDLRLRCDNESFEKIRKELLEKKRVEEEERKKQKEKKIKQQQQQRKPGSRSSSRSRGKQAASSSESSDDEARKKSSQGRTSTTRKPLQPTSASAKKTPSKRRSSSSDSSDTPFGKSKATKLTSGSGVGSLEGKLRAVSASGPASQKAGPSLDSKRGMDHVDFDKERNKASRSRDGFDLDKSLGEKSRVGLQDSSKGLDRRSPRDLDKVRGLGLDKDLERSRSGHLDLDKGRGLDKGLDGVRGRMDSDKGVSRSPRDLDKGKGRFEHDKAPDRSGLDLERGRSRLDSERDKRPLDLDRNRRGHLDLEKGRGLDKDVDKGRSRIDSEKGLTQSPRDLYTGKGRFESDKVTDRGALDQTKGRGHLDLERGRSPLDLERSRGMDKDLDRGRGRMDSEMGLGRSPRDLEKGKGRFEPDKGALELDRGRGRLDVDRGRQDSTPLDLDRGRSGHLDLNKGRAGLDKDSRSRDQFDLNRNRDQFDLNRNRDQFDLNRNRSARASPFDKPQIVVTGLDGRSAGSGKPRSFNLD